MVKRKDVLGCLPKPGKKIDIPTLMKKLEKKGIVTHTETKKVYRILDGLINENFLERLDNRNFRVIDLESMLDSLKIMIKKCEKNKTFSEWGSSSGFISNPIAEGVFFGIDEKTKLNDWQDLGFRILVERLASIFSAMQELLLSQDQIPDYSSQYTRELSLELLAYYLGQRAGDDHDGMVQSELILQIIKISKNIQKQNLMHIEEFEEFESYLKKIQSWKNLEPEYKKPKNKEQFGLAIIPGNYIINPDVGPERSILEKIQWAIEENKTPENITASLVTWYYYKDVISVLKKYEGYLTMDITKKVKDFYDRIENGFKVIYCLYDIAYCFQVIDGLKNKKLKVGFYDDCGKYVGKENTTGIFFISDGFFVTSDRPIGSMHFIRDAKQIKRKQFYESILAKTIDLLNKTFHKFGIDSCIRDAVFTCDIKLTISPNFKLDDFDWDVVLKEMGYQSAKNDLKHWENLGKKDAKNFVEKWLDRSS